MFNNSSETSRVILSHRSHYLTQERGENCVIGIPICFAEKKISKNFSAEINKSKYGENSLTCFWNLLTINFHSVKQEFCLKWKSARKFQIILLTFDFFLNNFSVAILILTLWRINHSDEMRKGKRIRRMNTNSLPFELSIGLIFQLKVCHNHSTDLQIDLKFIEFLSEPPSKIFFLNSIRKLISHDISSSFPPWILQPLSQRRISISISWFAVKSSKTLSVFKSLISFSSSHQVADE